MPLARPKLHIRRLGVVAALALAGMAAGCARIPNEKMWDFGGVDPNSKVAADVEAAEHAPGPYPKINKIPTMPTDLRSTAAWKTAVVSEQTAKHELETTAAAIPFTLNNTEGYATSTQARINPALSGQAPADAQAQAEAYAAAQAARATPPPKPH
jgi:hypothetical protein